MMNSDIAVRPMRSGRSAPTSPFISPYSVFLLAEHRRDLDIIKHVRQCLNIPLHIYYLAIVVFFRSRLIRSGLDPESVPGRPGVSRKHTPDTRQ